jgi:hypothetical protein
VFQVLLDHAVAQVLAGDEGLELLVLAGKQGLGVRLILEQVQGLLEVAPEPKSYFADPQNPLSIQTPRAIPSKG